MEILDLFMPREIIHRFRSITGIFPEQRYFKTTTYKNHSMVYNA